MRIVKVALISLFLLVIIQSCRHRPKAREREIINDPKELFSVVSSRMEDLMDLALENQGKMDDSTRLFFPQVVAAFYEETGYRPVWSADMKFTPLADSLIDFLGHGAEYGLFPDDYYYDELSDFHKMMKDSINRKDAVLWATADLVHTDVFMKMAQDLKQGRLQPDSLSWSSMQAKQKRFFLPMLKLLLDQKSLCLVTDSLQPKYRGYLEIKNALKGFLAQMDTNTYTYVEYPFEKNNEQDSLRFLKQLQMRLAEVSITDTISPLPDSAGIASWIKLYQAKKKLKEDGKLTADLIRVMNSTDQEKFKRIAIVIDKYKQLPDTVPQNYIWVNLPEFRLVVWNHDSLLLESKIVCGKPITPTPEIMSAISNIVVYPTWTVPVSIIKKEILPGIKKDPRYLTKKGFYLLDKKGELVNADTVKWKKYTTGIPYKVQQGSGEDNALGVIKFNFPNSYDVYLHDTNQRNLFKRSFRALSHGCVRVQEWEKLSAILLSYDSSHRELPDSLSGYSDSIKIWISREEKHRIGLKSHFPLFIRYFGCVAREGRISFLEDIYKLDKQMRDAYFSDKKIIPILKSEL